MKGKYCVGGVAIALFLSLLIGCGEEAENPVAILEETVLQPLPVELGQGLQVVDQGIPLVLAAPAGIAEWRISAEAVSWVGVPYKHGGETRSGIDCSGLVRQVYMAASGGRAYYRDRDAQGIMRASYSVWPPRTGDLLFFVLKGSNTCTHVGIFIDSGPGGYWDSYFVHALYQIGTKVVNKVVQDRLYYSPYGAGVYYQYFNVYVGRYNPDYWIN